MTDHREHDNLKERLDNQDEMLRQILTKMAEHRKEHEIVDPSILEVVDILKGIKFLKTTTIVLASVSGFLWAAWVWAKDHIKL